MSIRLNPGLLFLVAYILVWSAGCSTVPTDAPLETTISSRGMQDQWLNDRRNQLQDIASWQINARFSLITDSEAWSGKLDWSQQSKKEYLIHFSDPAGQGAMMLLGNNFGVELRLANGNTYQAQDADTLLREETDWELPIKSLWYWVRALPDPTMSLTSEVSKENLPVKLEQEGWTVNYQNYRQVDHRAFPRKITIIKDTFKLKLIIMNWVIA